MRVRILATAAAVLLLVAACGDDDTGDAHMHGDTVDAGANPPAVTMEVLPDPVKGWNVFADVTGMAFTPGSAGLDHVTGEGHAHLYVDGEKVARPYGTAYHLTGLEPGSHEIRYTLNANDHRTYATGGEEIGAVATIEVPEPEGDMDDGHMHADMAMVAVDGPIPTVGISVTADPVKGWNVHMPTTDFTWLPRKAGATDPVWGEGHAHLYVDGQKIARVYDEWFHMGPLDPGAHEVRVTLNHHDHSDYMADGAVIEAVASVEVEGETAAALVIEVDATGDRAERVTVPSDERVTLRITTAESGRIHVHGYDVYVEATAGTPTDVTFTASIPGVFEIEIEETGTQVAELTVE